MVIVAGGKYTTYRVMAKDAVDMAVGDLDTDVPASVTDSLAAARRRRLSGAVERARPHRARAGLTQPQIEHLLSATDRCVDELLELIAADPQLGKPLAGSDYLRVEAVYAACHEGALHLEDVLTRRTRISIEERDRGLAAAAEAARLIAPVLGWDEEAIENEIRRYRSRVEAELASQEYPDDSSANEARRAATDLFDTTSTSSDH